MEQFDALWAPSIDSTLGLRCTLYGYQCSEILHSLICVYLCGGSRVENGTTHLMKHQFLHSFLRTCSADKMNDMLVNALKQVDKFLLPLPSCFPHYHIEDYLLDTFINN